MKGLAFAAIELRGDVRPTRAQRGELRRIADRGGSLLVTDAGLGAIDVLLRGRAWRSERLGVPLAPAYVVAPNGRVQRRHFCHVPAERRR